MRQGMSPTKAAEEALLRIVKYYNKFEGALVAVNKDGEYGMLPFIFLPYCRILQKNSIAIGKIIERLMLTHFSPVSHFYTP